MSESEQQQATDILLPSAKVAVFSTDEQTLASAAAVGDDWRFARVDMNVVEGDVENAISTFQKSAVCNLLILQTDNIDDEFTARLAELSGYCEEGTAAIVVGPVNDVYLYRKLIDMGVSVYLVRPLMPEDFSEVIAKTLISRLGVSDRRLIAVTGAKGGVGTSTIAQMLSLLMSKTLGQSTTLLDAAGGYSSLSVGLGFDPSSTLQEVARAVEAKKEDALMRSVFNVNEKLTALTTGADALLDPVISAGQFEAILNNIMTKSPVVVVDLSCADPAVKKTVVSRAHHTIIVTAPTITSLRLCRSLMKEISDVRGGETECLSLIVNKQGCAKAYEVDKPDIKEALEIDPEVFIPYAPSIYLKYECDMKDMLSDKDGGALEASFLPLLKNIAAGDIPEGNATESKNSGFLGDFLNKFTAK